MKPVPIGAGMIVRRVRVAERDVVVLGGILHGEDNFASIHGEPGTPDSDQRVVVSILTTEARARELDAWLEELREGMGLEILP